MDRPTVDECRAELSSASVSRLAGVIRTHADDPRAGVRAAVETARKRLARERAEMRRLARLAEHEDSLRAAGSLLPAGLDEVGRGALAGPLTVGAVILPPGTRIPGLDDSKRLTPERREELAPVIREVAITYAVVHLPAEELDRLGMTSALRTAMNRALAALAQPADHALVDGRPLGLDVPETAIVKGDSKVAAIAAASIIAKVERDALMCSHSDEFPAYGFEINKGYGTAEHVSAIETHGLCPLHRRSFAPCGGTLRLF